MTTRSHTLGLYLCLVLHPRPPFCSERRAVPGEQDHPQHEDSHIL